jgi:isopentenyl-diphosphate Delta-isomerase
MEQKVILVNEKDEQTGTMDKMEAHRLGCLHRAFSVFVFNSRAEMLLQQRSNLKYHSGGLWTNACCSHPRPGEETSIAAQRRLKEELGFSVPVQKAFDFLYQFTFDNGLTENEFDHVFIGTYDGLINPDPAEVRDFCFKNMDDVASTLSKDPKSYTVWFGIAFPMLQKWMAKNVS